TLAARLSRSRSALGSPPPAASIASITRAPAANSNTPGVTTAPATCTTTLAPDPFPDEADVAPVGTEAGDEPEARVVDADARLRRTSEAGAGDADASLPPAPTL